MKIQEILDIVSSKYTFNKITESTNPRIMSRNVEVLLPYISNDIDELEGVDFDELVRIIDGAIYYLKAQIGDAEIIKYDVRDDVGENNLGDIHLNNKLYKLGDIPLNTFGVLRKGTLYCQVCLSISYKCVAKK